MGKSVTQKPEVLEEIQARWLYLIALWTIVRGIFEIVIAIRFRKQISNEWALMFGGIISIIFGVIVLTFRVYGLPQRLEGSHICLLHSIVEGRSI